MMPESTEIALHIAKIAGEPLLPSEPAEQEAAKRLYAASQALPLAWPMVTLVRFPHEQAESIMRGESLGEFMEGSRAYDKLLPTLQNLADQLAASGAPFFGGDRPHMGDFGLWKQADNLATLEPAIHMQLGPKWVSVHARNVHATLSLGIQGGL